MEMNNQENMNAESLRIKELKVKMMQQMNDMSYADALSTMSELIAKKCYEPDVIYQGAKAYFLIGDYNRAADWVNNTLHYDSQHIDARLLLAKICLLEDRTDDAMALYTYVLQNYPQKLTNEQREEIKEGAYYTWRTDGDWLSDQYPLVADLCSEQEAQNTENNGEQTNQGNGEVDSVEDIVKQVLAHDTSLTEQIKLLNRFAGGYFVSRDFSAAQLLLEKALEIDGYDKQTLTNLAVLAKMQGNVDKALAYAAQIPECDFVLLRNIME